MRGCCCLRVLILIGKMLCDQGMCSKINGRDLWGSHIKSIFLMNQIMPSGIIN